jgi:hypothetical protein
MKKKLKKILSIILGVVLVLIIVIVLAITLFANTAIKKGIQIAGTKALGVNVDVDSVNLSILRGRIAISNLVIDNPPDYELEKMLQLKDCVVDVDVGSLMTDTIHIEEITLDGMNFVLEQKTLTKNNIKDILNALPKSEPSDEPEQEEKEEGAGKNLNIVKLDLTDISVQAKLLPIPGKSDTVNINLAPISMTNLGTGGEMDFASLARKILLAVVQGIAKDGAGVLPDGMVDSMKDSYDKALESSKELLDIGKEQGSGLLEGVKDLFKKDEDE